MAKSIAKTEKEGNLQVGTHSVAKFQCQAELITDMRRHLKHAFFYQLVNKTGKCNITT